MICVRWYQAIICSISAEFKALVFKRDMKVSRVLTELYTSVSLPSFTPASGATISSMACCKPVEINLKFCFVQKRK